MPRPLLVFQTIGFSLCTWAMLLFHPAMATARAQHAFDPQSVEELGSIQRSDGTSISCSQVIKDRDQTIGFLLRVLEEEQTKRNKTHTRGADVPSWAPMESLEIINEREIMAVQALGALHAVQAVKPLLAMIDLEQHFFISTANQPERDVILALVAIGKPASRGALELLAQDKSEERARLYVRVIAQVEGVQVGKMIVQLAVDMQNDPQKKSRLQRALLLFDRADTPIP